MRKFFAREFLELGVVPVDQLLRFFDLIVKLLEGAVFAAKFRKRTVFARKTSGSFI